MLTKPRNGFTQPYHNKQITAWVFFVANFIAFYVLILPAMDAIVLYIAAAVHSVASF
jgi:hypothetical protein